MNRTDSDIIFDDLFENARGADLKPTDDLMARVLADAETVQSGCAPAPIVRVQKRRHWFQELLGGWPVVGPALAAGLTGLWIGISPPVSVESWMMTITGSTQTVSFLSDTEALLYEELSDG